MRMENFGKEVKKRGFLEGTKLWKIRNRTIFAVVTIYAGLLIGAIKYIAANKDFIKEKKQEFLESKVDPDLEKRIAFYEQIKQSHDAGKV